MKADLNNIQKVQADTTTYRILFKDGTEMMAEGPFTLERATEADIANILV